jgi:hypothetical protein
LLYLLTGASGRLWEVSVDNQRAREVVTIPEMTIKDMAVAEAEGIYWSPDEGKTLYVRTHDNNSKKDGLYSVQVQTGAWEKLYDGDESIGIREMGSGTHSSDGPKFWRL